MSVIEHLRRRKSPRVMDLVSVAGVDVSKWAWSDKANRPVKIPASNPAYCYEWSFIERGRVVVLNVWHREIQERNGDVWCNLNLRAWAEKGRNTEALRPSEKSALAKRSIRMDEAIAYAFNNALLVRLIIGEGSLRDITNPKSNEASRMRLRLLDPEPWSVQRYDPKTGECRLILWNGTTLR